MTLACAGTASMGCDDAGAGANGSGDSGTHGDGSMHGDAGGSDAGFTLDGGLPSGPGVFVAAGYGGTIYASTDGTSWEIVNDDTPSSTGGDDIDLFRGVCGIELPSGERRVLAVGGSGAGGRIARSSDGFHWQHDVTLDGSAPTNRLADTNWLGGCASGAGVVVAAGAYGAYTSTDGRNWTTIPSSAFSPMDPAHSGAPFVARALAFGNGVFVATGNFDYGVQGASSGHWVGTVDPGTKAITWTNTTTFDDASIFFGGGVFVSWKWQGSAVHVSSDGKSWIEATIASYPSDVAYDGTALYAVSASEGLSTSTNGTRFDALAPALAADLVAYGNGVLVGTAWDRRFLRLATAPEASSAWTGAGSFTGNAGAPTDLAFARLP